MRPGAQIHLGLEPREDVARGQGIAQLLLVAEAALDRLPQLGVEHLDAVPSPLLGPVLRGVGVGEERLRVVGRVEVGRDPDARRDVEAPARDLERVAERVRDPLGDRDRLVPAVDPVEQQRELVAAETGEQVLAAHHALEAARDLGEQQVADAVTERVVDDLEPVDVEVQHADRAAVAPRGRGRLLQALHERGPIREAGQVVTRRLLEQAAVGLAQADGRFGRCAPSAGAR